MSQAGNVQVAWQRRRRRLGDSIPGCILAIALVLGGTIWGYFKFVHWQPLVKAGHAHKTFDHKKNPGAYLEYGRRFRTGFAFGFKSMTKQNYDLVRRFKKGNFNNDAEGFDRETTEFMNQLLDSVQQFDGQQVPAALNGPHSKLSRAHGLCYESILFLRDAMKAEGADRDRLVKDSEKKMKEAWSTTDQATKEFYRIWAVTSTSSGR